MREGLIDMSHAAVTTPVVEVQHREDVEVSDEPTEPTSVAGATLRDATTAAMWSHRQYRHSPLYLGRLLALGTALVLVVVATHYLDRTAAGLRLDVQQAANRLSVQIAGALDAAALTVAVLVFGAAIAREVSARRPRSVAVLVAGAAVAFGVTVFVASLVDGTWAPTDDGDILVLAGLAAGAAVLAMADEATGLGWFRVAAWVLVVPGVVAGAWTQESMVGRVVALLAGAAIGALVALIGGTPSRQATATDVIEALGAAGFPVQRLGDHPGDARGSKPWIVELETGSRLFVKTHSAEERIADLLFRLWRVVRLRTPGDTRPHSSLLRAVEHEAFVSMRAASAGARTPRLITMGSMPSSGVFAAYELIEGETFQNLGEKVTDAELREAWSLVRILHRAGLAHRDLRAANLIVRDSEVWLIDFGFAETSTDPQLVRLDLVELLASTAAIVGQERAVDAAIAVLGREAWSDALPFIQPLAVSTATRTALGRAAFTDLRSAVALATQETVPDLPRLARIDRATILTVLALGAAVWVLVPQIAESGDLWEKVQEADVPWLLLAALTSMATYVGAALALRGANADELPMLPTMAAQVASSFVNRITPAKAGGVALNVRWLARQGMDTASATAAVGLNVLAGMVVHVVLTIFVVLWAGSVGLGDLALPSAHTVLVGLGIIVGVIALTFAVPPSRRLVRHRVFPRVRESGSSVARVMTNPRHLVLLFGGSAMVTICYIAALAISMKAFDVNVAVSTIALVYLAGSALASAAPTPGGLGATEAILVAGFVAVGVPQSEAIAGVLVFRGVTFWLPILPGWIAFVLLQRSGQL